MSEIETSSKVLAYADNPARRDIVYDVGEDVVSFVIPPPKWWRRAEITVPLAVSSVLGANLVLSIAAMPRRPRIDNFFAIAFYGFLVVGGLMSVILNLPKRRPIRIELTHDALRLENICPLLWRESAALRTLSYPRRDIYDVRFLNHSGNLLIKVHGQEMLEFRPLDHAETLRWVAQELRRALGLPRSGADDSPAVS